MLATKNQTIALEFILLGFSNDLRVKIVIFLLICVVYLITCTGNVLIFCVVIFNSRLHTPMYYFICNLSFLDLCYSTNAVPKLLVDIFSTQRTISFAACSFQLYSSLFFGGTECLLLAFMAYDRYVAICQPLYYSVLMSWKICCVTTVFIWIGSFIILIVPSFTMPISLCYPNIINHFMCEVLAVIKLSCGNIFVNELTIFCLSFISLLLPFLLIIVSYICIIFSILKIDSIGRAKAFSTCTSHLTVVILYYGTAMTLYIGPSSSYFPNQQKYISIFYVIITPMLNPIIYSLKNAEFKKSFKKLFCKYLSIK